MVTRNVGMSSILLTLAVSAINVCEICVNDHESSLMKLGTIEERIFDAVRIASLVAATGKIIYCFACVNKCKMWKTYSSTFVKKYLILKLKG